MFIICAIASPQQKFVAIWCALAACSIVTVIFMLCLQLVTNDMAAHTATVSAQLAAIDERLAHLATRLDTVAPASDGPDPVSMLRESHTMLRKLITDKVTGDLEHDSPRETAEDEDVPRDNGHE